MTAIVTVTYNSERTLVRCLESTRGVHHVVVDNGSRDGSADVAAQFPHVELVRNPGNRGFSTAANLGIQISAPADVLLINPDAYLLPGALERLEATLKRHREAAVVAPRLRYLDGTIQASARTFPSPLTMLLRRTVLGMTRAGRTKLRSHLHPNETSSEVEPVDWVLGAAMLIRRGAFDAVGGFDEQFFLYGEDVDFCYRLWAARWQVLLDAGAEVIHEYARESSHTWDLRRPATRHHWMSAGRLFARHPQLIVGRSPRSE